MVSCVIFFSEVGDFRTRTLTLVGKYYFRVTSHLSLLLKIETRRKIIP